MEKISLLVAFGAGILSFFSPCILPLIPAYVSFITGLSLDELRVGKAIPLGVPGNKRRSIENLQKIFWQTILFVLGFSCIFVALGATAGYLGDVISRHEKMIRIAGGSVIVILGLHVTGIFNIKQLQSEKKLHLRSKPANIFGAFIIGMVFAIGWTPCVGPALAAILGLAGTQKTVAKGVMLLSAYSLGLGFPFILTALAMNAFLNLFSKVRRYLKAVSIVTGLLLIGVGILIIIGWPNTI